MSKKNIDFLDIVKKYPLITGTYESEGKQFDKGFRVIDTIPAKLGDDFKGIERIPEDYIMYVFALQDGTVLGCVGIKLDEHELSKSHLKLYLTRGDIQNPQNHPEKLIDLILYSHAMAYAVSNFLTEEKQHKIFL